MKKTIGILVILLAFAMINMACTTIGVTKGASVDGSVMVTHTCDCGTCDFRIIRTPAMDFEEGAKRACYPYLDQWPAYVGEDRGPGWENDKFPDTEPLGYIDQVPHTYAYFGSSYGMINEHQLSIGECTTAAKTYARPEKGVRLLDISELSRIALERCKTAKEAVQLMGDLAVEYGYYGWGETLVVGDTKEIWIIEMCASPDQKSALWAAKKVPDGEVFVEANCMRIRDLDPDDPNTMHSPNLVEICAEQGWYDPDSGETFDWMRAVSPGEYSHAYYSHRRVWRTMDRMAPSLELSPWVEDTYTREYPFSVKPDEKLSVADVIDLQRDWYQDTEFDLSEGLAAGPFGTPNRYAGGSKLVEGSWERAISIFRCAYVFVTQSRDYLPDPVGGVIWFGPDAPHTSAYVPFYCGMNELPEIYERGYLKKFDRNTAGWAFNFLGNWADLKFDYMIEDMHAKQLEIEGKEFAYQPAIEKAAVSLYKQSPELAKEFLTNYAINNANAVVEEWWEFTDEMVAKYIDGYVNGEGVGYPDWWLKEVGYEEGNVAGEYEKQK